MCINNIMTSWNCCWRLRKTTSSSRLDKEESYESHESVIVTSSDSESGVKPGDYKDPFITDFRLRSKSASDVQSKPQKSSLKRQSGNLEGILEEASNTTSNLYPQVISNPLHSFPSESSIYTTPPTSRRSEKDPLTTSYSLPVKGERVRQGHFSHSVTSLSTTSVSPPPELARSHDHHKLQTLIVKLEESEQDRQRRHDEMRGLISELNTKLTTLVDTMLNNHNLGDNQQDESDSVQTDNVQLTDKSGDFVEISSSVLPQNAAVSSQVLLKLAKIIPKWKFLARLLEIEEHEIQQISENFPNDVQEQSYQMLLKWKQSHSISSYQILGEAINEEFGEQVFSAYVKIVISTEKNRLTANSQ